MAVLEIGPYILSTTVSQSATNLLCRGYRSTGRVPIIAKIPRGDHPSSKDLAKLRHEYAILKDLNHAGVPKVYDLLPFRSGSALFIDDKGYVSLTEVLNERKLPLGNDIHREVGSACSQAFSKTANNGVLPFFHDGNVGSVRPPPRCEC